MLDLIAPAQYWHDPFNHTDFLNGSIYLADINNEREEKRDEYRENLVRLENFVMVRWRDETTIIPAASSQFGFYLPGQVIGNIYVICRMTMICNNSNVWSGHHHAAAPAAGALQV